MSGNIYTQTQGQDLGLFSINNDIEYMLSLAIADKLKTSPACINTKHTQNTKGKYRKAKQKKNSPTHPRKDPAIDVRGRSSPPRNFRNVKQFEHRKLV